MDHLIERAAGRLQAAARSKLPCGPIRAIHPGADVDWAYAVQDANTEAAIAAGRRLVGRKIGLTSKVVQTQLGVDQPDFGMLFADMARGERDEIAMTDLMQPKIEAEIAFVLRKSLDRLAVDASEVADAVDYAVPALEIVSSRILNWDIRIVDTVADNASSGLFVLGARRATLDALDLEGCTMEMRRNGAPVSTGSGAACLGNVMNAAVWLANEMVRRGHPLRAGDVVLTGALGPMVPVVAGDAFEAEIDGLGSVRATFGAGS